MGGSAHRSNSTVMEEAGSWGEAGLTVCDDLLSWELTHSCESVKNLCMWVLTSHWAAHFSDPTTCLHCYAGTRLPCPQLSMNLSEDRANVFLTVAQNSDKGHPYESCAFGDCMEIEGSIVRPSVPCASGMLVRSPNLCLSFLICN